MFSDIFDYKVTDTEEGIVKRYVYGGFWRL